MDDETDLQTTLDHMAAHGGFLWITTGPAGDAHDLLSSALGSTPGLLVRGRHLRSRGQGRETLARLSSQPVPDADYASSARFMEQAARRLLEHRVIIVEELDLAADELAQLWVGELHAQRGDSAVVIESRRPAFASIVRRGDVRQQRLQTHQPLAASDANVCRDLDADLRRALITVIVCDDSSTGDALAGDLVAIQHLDGLRKLGLLDGSGCVRRDVREAYWPRLQQDAMRPDIERAIARHLLEADTDAAADLGFVAQLLSSSPDNALLGRLARRFKPGRRGPEVLQAQLDELTLRGRLPPRARLLSYRANAEGYQAALHRDLHDAFCDGESDADRLLADTALIRAAVWSGLRVLPREVDGSLARTQADGVPQQTRAQMALLWGAGSVARGPAASAEPDATVALIRNAGVPQEVVESYAEAIEGSRLAFSLQMDPALEKLASSARGARACGYETSADAADRLRMVMLYLANRTGELGPLLGEVAKAVDSERREYIDLFEALLEWQRGDTQRLQRQCRVIPERPPRDTHPLLPRPHFRDYLPFVFRVLRDRALDMPPDLALVPVFEEAVQRLRFFFATTLGAVALAQHCLLWDEVGAARRLARALSDAPGGALQGALLQGLCDHFESLQDGEALAKTLELAGLLPDPTTTPHYAMLATRIALRHDLPRGPFVEHFDRLWSTWRCPVVPEQMVAACRQVLVDPDAGGAGPIARQVMERVTAPLAVIEDSELTAEVRALRSHIQQRWNGPLGLGDYARGRGTSPDALGRRFSGTLGRSPKQYQTDLRLARAERLILETRWDLTRVALECGFYDAAHLSRIFTGRRGLGPQDFRKQFG